MTRTDAPRSQRRVLDPVVVVLRPLEDDDLPSKTFGRVGQEAGAELLVDDADLHHRAVEEVARQHDKAGLLLQRHAIGADHLAVGLGQGRRGSRRCVRPVTVIAPPWSLPGLQQLLHHRRHAARAMEGLAQEAPGRLAIDQQRDVVAEALPSPRASCSTPMCRAMAMICGGQLVLAPERAGGDDRILERLPRHAYPTAAGSPAPSRRSACRSHAPSARARGRGRGSRRSRAATCRAPPPGEFIDSAVPMVLQWPTLAPLEATISMNPS